MDCEIPEVYTMKTPIARKAHKCCECGILIKPGEKYVVCSGVWDGEFSSYKQHLECKEACVVIRDEFEDGECIPFGSLFEFYSQYTDVVFGHADKSVEWFKTVKAQKGVKELRHLMAVILNRSRK